MARAKDPEAALLKAQLARPRAPVRVDGVVRGPQKIGNIVAQLLARKGYAQSLAQDDVAAAWGEVAGKLAVDSRAGAFRGGTLEITVRNSLALQELNFQKKSLTAALASKLPDHKLKALRFKVGSLD